MGLKKEIVEELRKKAESKAKELAHEAEEKLTDKYLELIGKFYGEYDSIRYMRTNNLYNSGQRYYKNSHGRFVGGVKIGAEKMHDYPAEKGIRGKFISADSLMSGFIYSPTWTWHGGDMHGGYGKEASFGLYSEIHRFHRELKEELKKRCEGK